MASEVNVWAHGKWYGPSYPAAGDLPADPTETNERADEAVRDAQPEPPPRAGSGSSRAKWAAYATEQNVEFGDEDTRDDIIDACQAAGVPVD